MTTNEIKKELYKQNPVANLELIRKGLAHYSSKLASGENVWFEVPVSDMGGAAFLAKMELKFLCRYIKNEN